MGAIENLPEGYKKVYSLNLKQDKKTAIIVNLLAVVISIILAVPMHFFVSIFSLFNMENGIESYVIRIVALCVFMILYIILHEAVHGIAMKICGTKKVRYGFTGLYAFAGSQDYYDKKSYIFIALAPIVFFGIVLAIINLLVPTEWFWVVYIIQAINISGATGDLFVTVKFSRQPKDIRIQDYGLGMTVFSKEL